MMSTGSVAHTELGWRVMLGSLGPNARKPVPIRSGDVVCLHAEGAKTYMHSNTGRGGPYSGGGFSPAHGWIIEKADAEEGDRIHIDDVVMFKSISPDCEAGDNGWYMASNCYEGGGLSWLDQRRPDFGW